MQQLLIIEDDRVLNQGLCKALKTEYSADKNGSMHNMSNCDRQIVSCENLKEAEEQLLCGIPSLILLDINLPDGSGLDFLQKIKREHPECPVILLTANDTDYDIVNGLELGADYVDENALSVSIKRLRDKLGADNAIKTVYGIGYRWEV